MLEPVRVLHYCLPPHYPNHRNDPPPTIPTMSCRHVCVCSNSVEGVLGFMAWVGEIASADGVTAMDLLSDEGSMKNSDDLNNDELKQVLRS